MHRYINKLNKGQLGFTLKISPCPIHTSYQCKDNDCHTNIFYILAISVFCFKISF